MSEKKFIKLQRILAGLGPTVVAFSGGVDSTFLTKVASRVLAERLVAVTVFSPFISPAERKHARALAREFKIKHVVLELPLPDHVLANNPDRCYQCKKIVFSHLVDFARQNGCATVIEGSNRDDLKDYRPGRKALAELSVRSPLLEAGLTKADIRRLSKQLGLSTWDKPSWSCLATRLPYGEKITPEKLAVVAAAEEFLYKLGLRQVRVRLHGELGRIEVPTENFALLLRQKDRIIRKLKILGVKYVCLDLAGYRSGSMNEVLAWKRKK